MFENLKCFEWKDLTGRTVKIQSSTTSDGTIVVATDVDTNELFVVQHAVVREE